MSTDGYFADAELFGTCSYYHYDTQQEHDKPIIKKKSKYEIFLLTTDVKVNNGLTSSENGFVFMK